MSEGGDSAAFVVSLGVIVLCSDLRTRRMNELEYYDGAVALYYGSAAQTQRCPSQQKLQSL